MRDINGGQSRGYLAVTRSGCDCGGGGGAQGADRSGEDGGQGCCGRECIRERVCRDCCSAGLVSPQAAGVSNQGLSGPQTRNRRVSGADGHLPGHRGSLLGPLC